MHSRFNTVKKRRTVVYIAQNKTISLHSSANLRKSRIPCVTRTTESMLKQVAQYTICIIPKFDSVTTVPRFNPLNSNLAAVL